MASVHPPHHHDTYSRYRVNLSLPSSLSALSSYAPQHRPLPPPPPVQQHPASYSHMPPPPVPKRKRDSASPAPESSASSSSLESEYDPRAMAPKTSAPRQKRLQSKPPAAAAGGGSKIGPNGRPMSREQLRKANHSLIERRRREKINTALAELRAMVPGLGEENGGKGGEFKLEVLERTVVHMRLLMDKVAGLEAQLAHKRGRSTDSDESMQVDEPEVKPRRLSPPRRELPPKHSSTPPSPSMTPPSRNDVLLDPNETEDEANLPPPHTMASRIDAPPSHSHSDESSGHTASPHPPSISSLLSNAVPRTIPPPSRTNTSTTATASPNIYLPFPTPSPTSPFLTYHPSSASTASSATGPPEPSPFLAPVPNISLFGGMLDQSPITGPQNGKQPSPPEFGLPPRSLRDMGAEEAASVLLAISSPDTLRPTPGSTPLMAARGRPLEDNFTLDGGVATAPVVHGRGRSTNTQTKTARDILRM